MIGTFITYNENQGYFMQNRKEKITELKQDIINLSDDTYDIDQPHHEERMRILKAKRQQLKLLK